MSTTTRDPRIDAFIARSRENELAAARCADGRHFHAAANRLYYSAFHLIVSAFMTDGIKGEDQGSFTHKQVRTARNLDRFIRDPAVHKNVARIASRLYNLRINADYSPDHEVNAEEYERHKDSILELRRRLHVYISGVSHEGF